MSSTISNPAPAQLNMCTVSTDSGPVTTPCEPINEWLAITPAFGMDDSGKTWLIGGFVITHLPTGLAMCEGAGCINCCRGVGQKLIGLSSADWSTLTASNAREWSTALSEQDRETLALYRALEWGCDADLCQWPTEDGIR